jgi:hypothetical protein
MQTFGDHVGMAPESFVYEARYGWNGRTGRIVVVGIVFAVAGVALPLVLRIIDIVFFGGGALFFLGVICTRRVAFRVDASGVTLGGTPPRYRSGTRMVPWADIRKVVLWEQPMPYGRSMRYVGLVRRKGAPPLAGRRGQRLGRATARALVPDHVSGDTLLASRAVNSWRLDTGRLAAAVEHFAPHVKLVT